MKLLYSVIANVLSSVQDSPWWQEHLKKEEAKKWQKVRDTVCAGIVPHFHALIDNAVAYKKQMLEATSNQLQAPVDFKKVEMELSMTAKVVKQMEGLRKFVGVQPMTGPVGLVYHLGYRVEGEDGTSPTSMKMEITKHTATAMTRRLSARWGIEAMQDLQATHEFDFVGEITSAMGNQVFDEIANELVSRMQQFAASETQATLDTLLEEIRTMDSLIIQKTRRMKANFLIAGKEAVQKLSESRSFKPLAKEEVGMLTLVGRVGEIDVWLNPYMDKKVLVGTKGASDADAGLIYCPYVPLIMSGMVVDPNTFQPHQTTMTRYGLSQNDANYYGVINLV